MRSPVWSVIKKVLGPLAGLAAWYALDQAGEPAPLSRTAGLAVWMAVWWMTEAISIYFTALLPVFVFPLLNVMSMKAVAPSYMPSIIFLFIGGFFLAFALERWNLHKRLALSIILRVGGSPRLVLFGFMFASYVLSMWILNTATVTMMLPALLAVLDQMKSSQQPKGLAAPFLIGLAFASSIGGTATVIGTAPNIYFMEFFNTEFPTATPVSFASWFAFGFPVSLVFFVICFLVINYLFRKRLQAIETNLHACRNQYKALGPMGYEEYVIGSIFIITVLLWFTNKDIAIGPLHFTGWGTVLADAGWITAKYVNESTVAMAMAFLLMIIPAKKEKGTSLLRWEDAKRMPVGIIFLFGGGFALAKGMTDSGLSDWLGAHLIPSAGLHPIILVFSLCLFMTFFTEITSNTASTVLILPLLAAAVPHLGVDPYLLTMPVVFSASLAFMLPVATPPNTIVFGSDRLAISDMVRTGVWLNLAGAFLLTLLVFTLGVWIYEL